MTTPQKHRLSDVQLNLFFQKLQISYLRILHNSVAFTFEEHIDESFECEQLYNVLSHLMSIASIFETHVQQSKAKGG